MNEKSQIIKYLENAIILEKNVYQLKKIKADFEKKLEKCKNTSFEQEKQYLVDSFKKNGTILTIICFLSGIIFLLATQEIWLFFMLGGGFGFLFLGILLLNSHSTKVANEEIQKTNLRIRERNECVKKKQSQQCKILTQNISEIQKKLRESEELLNSFYSHDIVFEKYQNLIAICTFLEYFKSERCDSLTGRDGAYNIYENEIRLNLILGKMDQVINRLDNIQNNQYTLYNAINESNSKISQLCNSTENMLAHIENINTNTALTAYTSSITAINSTCQTWLMDSMLKEMNN